LEFEEEVWDRAYAKREDELRQWPYTIHSIDETLDKDRIEARAKQLLFQALNRRNLVAFVGSGVPIAYGRLSWNEWLSKQTDNIKSLGDAFMKCAGASLALLNELIAEEIDALEEQKKQEPIDADVVTHHRIMINYLSTRRREIHYYRREVQRLKETMDRMSAANDPFLSKEMPVVFEVASKLQEMLLVTAQLFVPSSKESGYLGDEKSERARFGFNPDLPHARAPADVYEEFVERKKAKLRNAKAKNFATSQSKLQQRIENPQTRLSVGDFAKRLLVDECAHAEGLIEKGLLFEDREVKPAELPPIVNLIRNHGAGSSDKNLRRDIKGIREDPSRYWSLAYFQTKFFMRLIRGFDGGEKFGHWNGAINTIRSELKRNLGDCSNGPEDVEGDLENQKPIPGRRSIVSPTHRFTLAMVLKLLVGIRGRARVSKLLPVNEPVSGENFVPEDGDKHLAPVKRSDFQSRRSLIDEELDPLAKTVITLGISHYLTTNYDFEIERYFRDRGYIRFSDQKRDHSVEPLEIRRQHQKNYPADPLGGFLHDDTFDPKRAPDLISFSIDHENGDAAVYHLHGRADDSSDLVITERDYMNMYLRNDRYRDTVDESIRVAFSANPILFLGLGMNEADLLRPFREFMSNRDGALGRTAIALSPGMDSAAKRAQDASLRFVRYGAHTIFYGDAWVRTGQKEKEQSHPGKEGQSHRDEKKQSFAKVDWLHRVMSLLSELESINREQLALKRDIDLLKANKDAKKANKDYKEKVKQTTARTSELGDPEKIEKRLADRLGTIEIEAGPKEGEYPVFDILFGDGPSGIKSGRICIKTLIEKKRSKNLVLRECAFTSRNPGDSPVVAKRIAAHARSMSFELAFIPQLVVICMKPFASWDGDACLAELEARKIAIEGLKTSILTSTMCIALDEIEHERDEWWHLWQAGPPVRYPSFRALTDKKGGAGFFRQIRLPTRFIRHEMDNTVTHVEDAPDDSALQWNKAYSDDCKTGVIPFDTFIEATHSRCRLDRKVTYKPRQRRLHIVMAHRGAGKGIFTSTLATGRGLANYIKANWSHAPTKPLYAAACYINLSFSSEVSSTFDMLEKAVWSAAEIVTKKGLGPTPAELKEELGGDLKDIYDNVKDLARLRRLHTAFRCFEKRSSQARQPVRLLVCISAVELLHYNGGIAKNREIEAVLRMLTGDESKNWPIDVVWVHDETTVSEVIAQDKPYLKRLRQAAASSPREKEQQYVPLLFVPTMRPDINPRGLQNIMRRMERVDIDFAGMEPLPPADQARGAIEKAIDPAFHGSGDVAYVHFARTVKPERLLIDNYLPLATILFFGFLDRENGIKPPARCTDEKEQRNRERAAFETFKISLDDRKEIFAEAPSASGGSPSSDDPAAGKDRSSDEDSPAAKYRQTSNERDQRIASVFLSIAGRYKAKENKELEELLLYIAPNGREKIELSYLRKVLLKRYEIENRMSDSPARALREWRDIRALLANNRYCLTIMLACAQRIALSKQTIAEAYEAAEDFIRNTVDHIKTVSEQKREEVVLSDVLDAYEEFDDVGKASEDVRLHLSLLRHLAVVAGPCSVDVLVHAPDIRHYFENIYVDNRRTRRERIVEALTELSERGLVFRLQPHPRLRDRFEGLERARKEAKAKAEAKDEAETDDKTVDEIDGKIEDYYGKDYRPEHEYRYALHRLMQRHVTRKMGSGPRDASQINSFAPSLYASMPADVPRLNQEAYTFLGSLVASMSQYPDHRAAMPGAENWHYAKAPRSTQIQALRAALGVVRSSFSIATVSRFEDYSQLGDPDASRRGYFEEYRVQVRWLIRKAYELLDRDKNMSIREYDPYSGSYGHINAFYVDEVVWLYNECGVVNLVQGNLSDAVTLLRQAISINRRVEGLMVGGAHHNRISLNLAIAQLERGRLTAARKRLSEICASEARSGLHEGRVWHLAHGYLGLVNHLMGDPERAAEHYATAIRVLSVYGDTRACAIFSRHAGDLERAQKEFKAAGKCFDNALAFAEAGGHEDVQKRVRLAMIRNEIAEARSEGRRPPVRQVMAELKMIGDYADTMEMPALRADVDHVRAELMINDGETTQAGQLLSRNLTITKRNEMYLRMNGALTRYAEVLHMRGLNEQANNMLFASLEMAKRSGSRAEINAVESVFERLHRDRNLKGH